MNNHAIRTIFPAKSNLFTWLSTEDGDGNLHANPSVPGMVLVQPPVLFVYLTNLLNSRPTSCDGQASWISTSRVGRD